MNRVLRAFALAEALTWVIYGVIFAIITHRPMTIQGVDTTTLLMNLDAQTGLCLGVVAGVAGAVVCLQQWRWAWAAVLGLLVILVLYINYVVYALYSFFPSLAALSATLSGTASQVAFQLFPGLALTLVVLASTFWSRPIAVE